MAGSDYGSQLRSALEAAQLSVQQQFQKSEVQRGQTAVTLGHARQALSVNDSNLHDALHALRAANTLFKIASQGKSLVQSTQALATSASTEATAAVNAMSTAANNIKALANAFDTLAAQVAGVRAVASTDDRNTAVDNAAKQAALVTAIADDTTERLKAASLDANVESAKSVAGAIISQIQDLGTQLQDLNDRASSLVNAATQKVTTTQKSDSADQQASTEALEAYHVALGDDESLNSVLGDFNAIANGALQVTQQTGLNINPSLLALYQVPDVGLDLQANKHHKAATALNYFVATSDCLFFAVPSSEAPAFDFDTAYKMVLESDAESASLNSPPPDDYPTPTQSPPLTQSGPPFRRGSVMTLSPPTSPPTLAYSCSLYYDTDGGPLEMGHSYCVFVLRQPQGGIMAARATDLSLPSDPITLTYVPQSPTDTSPPSDADQPVLTFAQADVNSSPPDGVVNLCTVTLTPTPDMDSLVSEYRAIIIREDVYKAIAEPIDAFNLANQLDSAFYVSKWNFDSLNPRSRSYTFTSTDTDAFGDLLEPKVFYRCLVLAVGGRPSDPNVTAANTSNVLLGTDAQSPVLPVPIPQLPRD